MLGDNHHTMASGSDVEHRVEGFVDSLAREFQGRFDRDEIATLMNDSLVRLDSGATVGEFVPLMAYRFTRERLVALARADRHAGSGEPGSLDVVYVSLSGGGRGQIAAALTAKLSGDRVSVHSAGTAVRAEIDPAVRAAIGEIGVDPDTEFARPVTGEVLGAADVIVTMGHSVGVFDLPTGVRHLDWRVGDPIGAPLEEVRRVRADIEARVRGLLDELGVPVAT